MQERIEQLLLRQETRVYIKRIERLANIPSMDDFETQLLQQLTQNSVVNQALTSQVS